MNLKFEKVTFTQFAKDLREVGDYSGEEVCSIYDSVKLPKRSTSGSAGYDFSTPIDFSIPAGGSVKIPSCIRSVGMPENVVLKIYVRSSVGIKRKVVISNGTGIIDSDYSDAKNEGHIWLAFTNNSDKEQKFEKGDCVAQGIFINYLTTEDDDSNGKRVGGIGSTGK